MNIQATPPGGSPTLARGGKAPRKADGYEAKIQKLQEKQAEYLEKLKEPPNSDARPEAKQEQKQRYMDAIANIDMQIMQLQQQKAREEQEKAAESMQKIPGESRAGKTESGGKTREEEEEERREEKILGNIIDLVA